VKEQFVVGVVVGIWSPIRRATGDIGKGFATTRAFIGVAGDGYPYLIVIHETAI
jgi:hypothetical protein